MPSKKVQPSLNFYSNLHIILRQRRIKTYFDEVVFDGPTDLGVGGRSLKRSMNQLGNPFAMT